MSCFLNQKHFQVFDGLVRIAKSQRGCVILRNPRRLIPNRMFHWPATEQPETVAVPNRPTTNRAFILLTIQLISYLMSAVPCQWYDAMILQRNLAFCRKVSLTNNCNSNAVTSFFRPEEVSCASFEMVYESLPAKP
jgi:hypothetical protein